MICNFAQTNFIYLLESNVDQLVCVPLLDFLEAGKSFQEAVILQVVVEASLHHQTLDQDIGMVTVISEPFSPLKSVSHFENLINSRKR